jgi:hypothetical protein
MSSLGFVSPATTLTDLNRAAEVPERLSIVRITHWITVLSVLALLVSGIGILVSHPRLYWGETGNIGTESLINLPIPFIIGPSASHPFPCGMGSGFCWLRLCVR